MLGQLTLLYAMLYVNLDSKTTRFTVIKHVNKYFRETLSSVWTRGIWTLGKTDSEFCGTSKAIIKVSKQVYYYHWPYNTWTLYE